MWKKTINQYVPFDAKHHLQVAWDDCNFFFLLNGGNDAISYFFWSQCRHPSEISNVSFTKMEQIRRLLNNNQLIIYRFPIQMCEYVAAYKSQTISSAHTYLELTSSNMPVAWMKNGQMQVVDTLLPNSSNSKRNASSNPTAANLLEQ